MRSVLYAILAVIGGAVGSYAAAAVERRRAARAAIDRTIVENRAAIQWELDHPLPFGGKPGFRTMADDPGVRDA